MEFTEYKLPIASSSVVSFIDLVPLIGSENNEALTQLNDDISFLKTLKTQYLLNISKEITAITESLQNRNAKYKISEAPLIYARKKYYKMFFKYHKTRAERFRNCFDTANELIKYLEECQNNNIPISFLRDQYIKLNNCNDDEKLSKYAWKIISIATYTRNKIFMSDSKVNPLQLRSALEKQAENVDEKNEFVKENEFDEMFFQYIIQSNFTDKFEQIVKNMSELDIKRNVSNNHNFDNTNILSSQSKLESSESSNSFSQTNIDNEEETFIKTIGNIPDLDSNILTNQPLNFSFNDMVLFSSTFYDEQCANIASSIQDIPAPLVFDYDDSFDIEGITLSLNSIDEFAKYFFIILDSTDLMKNSKIVIVMRCAIIRILFNIYYQKNEDMFYENSLSQTFLASCDEISNMNLYDLGVNNSIFHETLFENMIIKDILTYNNFFRDAIDTFTLLQFYNNPLDISFLCFTIINNIDNGLQLLLKIKESPQLSFDDMFSFFISCLSLNPISSPLGVHKFMNIFSDLKISDSLTYAKTFLTASIKHLLDSK